MSPEKQRIAIAEACGKFPGFVLKKRGMFYRPNGQGYTSRIEEAWVVDEAEANRHVYPFDEPVTKHPVSLPDYLDDLNAVQEAEKTLTMIQQQHYIAKLRNICSEDKNWPECATAAQRCEAFLRTVGKWKDD